MTSGLADYQKRSLFKSIEYSAWPLFAYTEGIREVFGTYRPPDAF